MYDDYETTAENVSLDKTCPHYVTYAHMAKIIHACTYYQAAKTNTEKFYKPIDITKQYTH